METKFPKNFLSLAIAGALSVGAPLLFAQDETSGASESKLETQSVAAQETEQDVQDEAIENVVVTGSRIKRDAFTSTAPVTVITADKSALAGLVNASDILQSSSVASGQQINDAFSGFVTDGGPGAETISLRGLGGQRSLVLVNGKRWAPSGVRGSTNSVDLTALPSGLISRYEILKDGASSIYGADAIAGVVNAITRESIDGGRVDFTYRMPEIGEGEDYSLDGVWGATGDNWSVSLASSVYQQKEIVQTDLDYAKCDTRPRLTDSDGNGTIDNRHPETGEELCFGMIYGFAISPVSGWARFDPSLDLGADASNPNYDEYINGTLGIPYYTRVPENELDNSGEHYRDTLGYSIAQLQTEMDLINISSLGSYDFSINELSATAYYEFYYNRRETRSNSGYRQFFPVVPADNPTNPFGTSGPLAAGGVYAQPVLPSYELVDPDSEISIDRYNFFAGLKGDLSATWSYDAYFGYGYSKGTYGSDQFLDDRVTASLDAELDSEGNLVCKDLVNNPGCVAANLFTEDALLYGRLTQAEIDYLTEWTEGETTYDSLQLSGHATGELFSMPAGEVMGVIGFEYREESIDDVPDEHSQADNLWGFTAARRTKGTDKVKEVYGELELPLLDNVLMAEELSLNVSTRWTDYDSYGDDTTYRAALNWQVLPSFRLRATKGTSFRAPDLYEIFLGDETSYASGLLDPCINYTSTFDPDDIFYQNCAAVVSEDFGQDGSKSILTVTGGADDLKAETSDSYTYGFVWQPEEIGLSVAVSWYDIEISNTVQSLSAGSLLANCYGSKDFSSPFCSRVGARDSDGYISSVDASFINVGKYNSSGYDIDMLYEHSFNNFDLSVDATFTYIDEANSELLGDIEDYEGAFGFPHWSGDMDVRIDYKEWEFNWRIDYIGSTAEEPDERLITTTDDELYHTLSARYTQGNWEVLGTVQNVLDDEPPIVSDGTGSVSASRAFNTLPGTGYPMIGRTFMVRLGYEF
ncbi:TonB-dependent receptor [Microbulbifer thermotolerans]|uniref:TonB-dependent receptor plug domain-containing protein n=1 Tax=Microbulbifer thermotolerans TaxID=252514 RepID=UPI00224A59DB|nr:TonB-dependent receptor [Microbulbifer thermotolerans]MCX2780918.1 TonB-dependent receptor [Microbulbifer thermotolerans]MCX2782097.1 TonB-dependent receptor [Microbulbifer thermotolerans]MCX2806257.1 TonB-dependent receptor [Microbulbifer thermotolerans]MCX2843115.1 TonB-dependent receptor [Microbulbifer thermotolerans]